MAWSIPLKIGTKGPRLKPAWALRRERASQSVPKQQVFIVASSDGRNIAKKRGIESSFLKRPAALWPQSPLYLYLYPGIGSRVYAAFTPS